MTIQEIYDSLLEAFHINELPEDKKGDYMNAVSQQIIMSVISKSIGELDDNALSLVETMMSDDDASPEELFIVLKEKIPHFDQIFAGVLAEFKAEEDMMSAAIKS